MALKLLIISTFISIALGQYYNCSPKSALQLLRRPAFEFSTKILERVAENSYSANTHFVFSPLSTWLQLTALAEGAKGRTFRELWHVTKHHRNRCFKLNLRRLLHKHVKGLKQEYRRKSLIVIDQYMGVKQEYINDVLKFYAVKVLLKNFDYPETAAIQVNSYINKTTNGVIDESVFIDDFNKTVLLLSDNVYFKSAWKDPFDVAFTRKEAFRTNIGTYLGDVNMMRYTGYLNTTDMRNINARVLEIPCVSNFSMLILMPIRNSWIGDMFYNLRRTTLMSIFNRFKAEGEKLVNVKLPRFRMNTTVDNLAELLFDMNVRSVFDPNLSDLSHISDYKPLYASLMTQVADIEVTEKGVRAAASAMSQINETAEKIDFFADRPFVYMIVERKTQFILFAGTYSVPSVY